MTRWRGDASWLDREQQPRASDDASVVRGNAGACRGKPSTYGVRLLLIRMHHDEHTPAMDTPRVHCGVVGWHPHVYQCTCKAMIVRLDTHRLQSPVDCRSKWAGREQRSDTGEDNGTGASEHASETTGHFSNGHITIDVLDRLSRPHCMCKRFLIVVVVGGNADTLAGCPVRQHLTHRLLCLLAGLKKTYNGLIHLPHTTATSTRHTLRAL